MSEACPKCGATVSLERFGACPICMLQDELPPVMVGEHLELGDEIGCGGMGTVYKARDQRLGRTVAIKFVSLDLSQDQRVRARFDREARALARLNHPHIVTIHGVGEHDEQTYIVMEYVDGGTLQDLLPVGEERAVALAVEICEAVAYAHEHGVLHRDIKPRNILIDGEGALKLTDFGLARILDPTGREATLTQPEMILGTPRYMSPEALSGKRTDERTDVYSIGVVLYEMATGEPPVGDFPSLSPDVDPIVRRALAWDPDDRFPTVRALKESLERREEATVLRPVSEDLPSEEIIWIRAMALLFSTASAIAIYAVYRSLLPREVDPEDLEPLTMFTNKRPDGTLVSYARFETVPFLGALFAFSVAFGVYGWLRRHWRRAGVVPGAAAAAKIPEVRWVFWLGWGSVALYLVKLLLESGGRPPALSYLPILGGAFLTVVLFLTWVAVVKVWRVGQPLRREWRLWAGFAVALVAPIHHLFTYIRDWEP